eukprot:200384_1
MGSGSSKDGPKVSFAEVKEEEITDLNYINSRHVETQDNPHSLQTFNKNLKKQSKAVNLDTIMCYLLINGLVRKVGVSLPWDIFICLIKYCDTFKFKYKDIKIWIFSWNMSSIKCSVSINELKQVIPAGY